MSPGDLRFSRDDRRVLCYEGPDMLGYNEVKGAIVLLTLVSSTSTMWKVLTSNGIKYMTIGELMTRTKIGDVWPCNPES